MTIDERARHELFLAAEQALGRPQTETLMELLPPVGWADVATKQDLAALEERMALRFEMADERLTSMQAQLDTRFEMADERLTSMQAQLDTRFEVVDERLTSMQAQLDTRFEVVDERLTSIEARLGTRLEVVGQRFERVDAKFDTQTAYLLGELDRRFNAQTRTLFLSLAGLLISLTTLVIAVR